MELLPIFKYYVKDFSYLCVINNKNNKLFFCRNLSQNWIICAFVCVIKLPTNMTLHLKIVYNIFSWLALVNLIYSNYYFNYNY